MKAKNTMKNTKTAYWARQVVVFVAFFFVLFAPIVVAFLQATPKRIISLVPNVTEILFAIGAGPQVVAVSTYDVEPPEVRSLPTVGALVDPDTERIIALRPDLVITYGSQSDLQSQLKAVNIPFFDYRHAGLDHIMVDDARAWRADGACRAGGNRGADAPGANRCGEEERRRQATAEDAAGVRPGARVAAQHLRERRHAAFFTTCWSSPAVKMS